MNIRRGENVHDFINHIFRKLQCFLISSTQHFPEHTKIGRNLVWATRTSQFRIRSQRCQHVSRHIDFRNHGNVSLGRISDDFFCFFLRIISAHRNIVEFFRATFFNRTLSLRTDFRQFRVFLDFYAPALVFREMPVKVIDIVQCQHVDYFLQIIHAKEMPAHVYHESSVTKPRRIFYAAARNGCKCGSVCNGQGFMQCLDAIKYAGLGFTF